MNNGLSDHTYISRNLLFKQWQEGQISNSEFDVLSKSIKVESQVIHSIQDVIEIKQMILSEQGKDEEAFKEIIVCNGFKSDPRQAFHKCPEQCSRSIIAEECYSWSRKPDNKKKCISCEWYEPVGKIFE